MEAPMSQFDLLVEFVKQKFPSYAYVLIPGVEIAADGLIFRAKAPDGLIFKDENGEQDIQLAEAQVILEEDLQEQA
jgi:hypothetical protein